MVVRRLLEDDPGLLRLERTSASPGIAQGSEVSPVTYQAQLDDQIEGLRDIVQQLHSNVTTLHSELIWARGKLLDTVSILRTQTEHHVLLHHTLEQLANVPDLVDWQTELNILLSRFSPARIDDHFPRIRNQFRAQDDLFEDMPVDSDSDIEYIDDPLPARVRARAADVLQADEYLPAYPDSVPVTTAAADAEATESVRAMTTEDDDDSN